MRIPTLELVSKINGHLAQSHFEQSELFKVVDLKRTLNTRIQSLSRWGIYINYMDNSIVTIVIGIRSHYSGVQAMDAIATARNIPLQSAKPVALVTAAHLVIREYILQIEG